MDSLSTKSRRKKKRPFNIAPKKSRSREISLKKSRSRKQFAKVSQRQRQRIYKEIRNSLHQREQPERPQSPWEEKNGHRLENAQDMTSSLTPVSNLTFDLCDKLLVQNASEVENNSAQSDPCAERNASGNWDIHIHIPSDTLRADDRYRDNEASESDREVDSDSSVSLVEDEDDSQIISFREQLANFMVENSINMVAGDKLLHMLRTHRCFFSLPKSTKTLLQTPRTRVQLLNMPPGEYLNLGLESAIIGILNRVTPDEIPPALHVDFSTDGANLDHSGNNQIWPLQCRVANIPNSFTELIGIYRGVKKPSSAMTFFQPFVEEVIQIIQNGGIMFNGSRIRMTLRAFIADAPARAYILNHMGHTSHHPCSKCKVSGETINRRLILEGTDHILRTDDEYKRQVDDEHHKGESPLSHLNIGMVSQVPYEYMHLVCLGVMKRLLMAWVDGKFSIETRLCAHDIDLVSARLECLYDYCPQEFARRPRKLSLYTKYKATEFRQFLLYTGPTVVRGILSDDVYKHFLLLHASMRILASSQPSDEQLFYAKMALRIFVQRSTTLYGPPFVSFNVHGLLHIVDDCKLLGPLDAFSAFPYENNIRLIRKYCRKPNLPLQQIANRRAESAQRNGVIRHKRSSESIIPLDPHTDGRLLFTAVEGEISQYRRLKAPNFCLSLSKRNNCCILRDLTICIVENIVIHQSVLYLSVRKFSSVEDVYNVALLSSSVGVFKCYGLQRNLSFIEFNQVLEKGYIMPYWLSHHLDANGKEQQAEGVYIVAEMSSIVNY